MSLQFNGIALFLVVLIALGVIGHNNSITVAATVLLLMHETALSKYIVWLDKYGLSFGIIILTIGVLSPLVSGKISLPAIKELLHWKMVLAVVVGILVAWLGGRGATLMLGAPTLVTGLLIGTIIGVAFLGGVPVGPLIAAGILSLFLAK
ncbi:membrane protein [Gallibacterium salpingitidis]|uniref:UPF0756 membrane protein QS62_04125 n=1 Tax=Gallibacterium salpingitidis TaxID=505341 RepID=A0A1A7P0N5_9PAST|nr:DUF441 domain-containing protein [Gallibacterium salpingitidis]OBW95311.1 membrane protein [Gallibacterium salpingitidis]OBX06653.1 membrane protein [Gallibacterium salpingitidis]OBX07405.1 membrane protein [Gallibacterium salpingitidis]WKT00478.1 DUF441 domain-containing protein [Gallibacterium salpingitidis]